MKAFVGGTADRENFKVYMCNQCGHAEMFRGVPW
jgi:hypothetical protein